MVSLAFTYPASSDRVFWQHWPVINTLPKMSQKMEMDMHRMRYMQPTGPDSAKSSGSGQCCANADQITASAIMSMYQSGIWIRSQAAQALLFVDGIATVRVKPSIGFLAYFE